MDWVVDLEDEGAAAVRAALTAAVEADDYLEAPEGEEAVAAAEVVASALGQEPAALPPAVKDWLKDNSGAVSPADARLALQAVERVNGDTSELYELWVEDAEDPDWPASMDDLRQRLTRAISA